MLDTHTFDGLDEDYARLTSYPLLAVWLTGVGLSLAFWYGVASLILWALS